VKDIRFARISQEIVGRFCNLQAADECGQCLLWVGELTDKWQPRGSVYHPVKPFAGGRDPSSALDPEPTAHTDPLPTFRTID
jgi:hypothetical protein